ncbi:replication factor A protein 1-like [Mercurialis annua]|uniref:replication factor A protein 1-like n=1 Tax=Mercurialis annua TaxID=3986 RepID=UPI00215FD41C|nr:replication factor A protein 1-like [Mercurialis annua]
MKNIYLPKEEELCRVRIEKVRITFWGTIATNFDWDVVNSKSGPFIIVVTSTTIKKFMGQYSLSSTSATKIYVNLQIPEVDKIRCRMPQQEEIIKVTPTATASIIPIEEQMLANRKTIAEILQLQWQPKAQEHQYTVMATIDAINSTFGWHYTSCNSCNKKLAIEDGSQICNTCNKACAYPISRYKIHLQVSDITGTTSFVLFDKEAEHLLHVNATLLMQKQGFGNFEVPNLINNLCGKKFIFKIKVNDYNLKQGLENYSISKIFNPDHTANKDTDNYIERKDNIKKEKEDVIRVQDLRDNLNLEEHEEKMTDEQTTSVSIEESVTENATIQKQKKTPKRKLIKKEIETSHDVIKEDATSSEDDQTLQKFKEKATSKKNRRIKKVRKFSQTITDNSEEDK